jgi:hypothetical protein
MKFLVILLNIFIIPLVHADQACSRVARVNSQEILVDSNSNLKGEGLRYLIDRDPIAKSHLDKYQKNSSHLLMSAGLGTAGTLLTVSGFVVNSNKETKRNLIIGGLGVLLVNYLMAKTLEYTNEENLNAAVDEYNRRNTPVIYFGPTIGVEVKKSF